MTTSIDVATFILRKMGSMTTMKLQKLVYYSQAWHLVWEEKPLFRDRIEAWANGPIVPNLYQAHRGEFKISKLPAGKGDWKKISDRAKTTILSVLDFYGDKSSQWLSDLTHAERPWKSVRRGLPLGTRSTEEITIASMAEYYGSLSS